MTGVRVPDRRDAVSTLNRSMCHGLVSGQALSSLSEGIHDARQRDTAQWMKSDGGVPQVLHVLQDGRAGARAP